MIQDDFMNGEDYMTKEDYLNEDGIQVRCGNCHEYIGTEDRYCVHCGTRRGEGKFDPFRDRFETIYGPPITSYFNCNKCGYSWNEMTMGRNNIHYCPKCGAGAPDFTVRMDWGTDLDLI